MTEQSQAAILHVDMDAFFASVEVLDHPEWAGRPLVVGARPDRRGVVAAASYEARQFGIHSAMPSRTAAQRCPTAVFAPVRRARYLEMSLQVMEVLERFTPMVEQISIDEAFLDVRGVLRRWPDAETVGRRIKAVLKEELGLTASVGVAPNKFLAKLASDLDKPDGFCMVPTLSEKVQRFLDPMPVERIWGVGPVTARRLREQGLATMGDLQRCPPATLEVLIGPTAAAHLHELAFGRDDRPVITEYEAKSYSREHTFDEDCAEGARVRTKLVEMVEEVGYRLRHARRRGRTVQLKLRDDQFRTRTRRQSLGHLTASDRELLAAATALLEREAMHRPVRLVGFGVEDLDEKAGPAPHATTGWLFEDMEPSPDPERERDQRLDQTVDQLKKQFGSQAVQRGGSLPDRKP